MKLLVDMNLPPRIADLLNDKGMEAVHWYGIGTPNATDSEILSYAHQHGYVVLTCDLDFTALLAASQDKSPSILQIRGHGFHAEELSNLIVSVITQNISEIKKGAIVSIDSKRARVKLLPLLKTLEFTKQKD